MPQHIHDSPPIPLNDPPPRVLVIGGGVIGITSAISLREAGFEVTVVAEKYENITSNVAGALWEWPPAVCGQHGEPHTIAASKKWCMVSYNKFKELHAEYGESESGVYLQDVFFYFRHKVEDRDHALRKMNELKDKIDGFARGLDVIPDEVDPYFAKREIKDCYKHMAPMIDTDVYLPWIQQKARDMGCILLKERIDNHVIFDEKLLRKRYNADAIIACPGLASMKLLGDSEVYPLRGALVRVKQPERIVTSAHCISHEENTFNEQDIVFITPRGKDTIVLGGLAQPNRWDYGLSLEDTIIQEMYQGCLDVLPALKSLEIDSIEPVRTGLRPMAKNIRTEHIPGTRVVVNYGHGGAGVTLSWGCAELAVTHVENMLGDRLSLHEIAKQLDSARPTAFILQDMEPFKADVNVVKFMNHNLVLICSRHGVTQVPAHNFTKFDLVHVVEQYELGPIVQSLNEIMLSRGLSANRCRVVTNDEHCILLSGQIREALGIPGPNATSLLPFFDKHVTKKVIGRNGPVRIPNYLVFNAGKFQTDPYGYVREVNSILGEKVFIKPAIGANCGKTCRLDSSDQLYDWCKTNAQYEGMFEIEEHISGELFKAIIIRTNGQNSHLYVMRYNRPSDEYLQSHKVGGIIVSSTDAVYPTLKKFSECVLHELGELCQDNGVYCIDLFLEEGTGKPVLIEVAAGAPGTAVSHAIRECCSIGLQETSLAMQMGHTGTVRKTETVKMTLQPGNVAGPVFKHESTPMTCYAAFCLHAPKRGIVERIKYPAPESSFMAFTSPRVMPGQHLSAPKSTLDVALMVVITNHDLEDLARDFELVCNEDYIIIQECT